MCHLARQANGIEPTLIGHVPAAITHVINGKSVALGPVAVNLTNIVETGRVIISGLEVLGLVEPVLVRELDLAELLLASSAADTSDIRDVARITCNDGDCARHGSNPTRHADRWDGACDVLDLGHIVLLRGMHEDRLLLTHGRLLDEVGLLMNDIASMDTRLRSHGTDDWLL